MATAQWGRISEAEEEPDRLAPAIRRARLALGRLTRAPDAMDDPLLIVGLDLLRRAGAAVDLRPLLDVLEAHEVGYGRYNALRYRWNLSWHSEAGSVAYRLPYDVPPPLWRGAEAENDATDRSAHGRRLMEPVVIGAQFDFWERVASDAATPPEVARRAAKLLDEATPVAEHELANWFAARDPWRDTFALWLFTASDHVTERFRHLLFALAVRYGGIAQRDGVVRGVRFPFYRRALVSASAHLASGLWRCGV